MAWTTPIYDRTQADVTAALATQSNDTSELKGAVDYRTWNRIEANTQYLSDTLNDAGYIVEIVTKTWTRTDKLYLADIQRMNSNIEAVKAKFAFYSANAPTYTTGKTLVIADINQMEEMIWQIEQWVAYITSPLYYQASGDANVVSGGSSLLWMAAKVNTPRSILATYITIINTTVFTTLSDTVASQADAVAELQTQVDALILDTMTATINVTSYTSNIGQTGSMVFTVTVTYGSATGTSNSCSVGIAENTISVTLAQQALMLEGYAWTALSEDATSEALATAEMQAQVDDVVSNGTVDAVSYTSNSGQTGSYSFVVVLETDGISLTTSVIAVDVTEQSVVPNVEFLASMQSDGVAYIDTEYYPIPSKTNIETEFAIISQSVSYTGCFGCRYSYTVNATRLNVFGLIEPGLRLDVLGTDTTTFSTAFGETILFEYDGQTNVATCNGSTFTDSTVKSSDRLAYPYLIFSFYNGENSTVFVQSKLEMSYHKIAEDGVYVRNLVPVRILATDEVCMYDYVTQKYYKNVAGSGSFTGNSKSTPEYGYVEIVSDPNTTLLLKSIDGAVVDISQYANAVTNVGAVVNDEGFTLGASSGYLSAPYDVFNNDGDFTVEWIEYCNGSQTTRAGAFYAGDSTASNTYGGLLVGYSATNVYAGTLLTQWNLVSGASLKDRTNSTAIEWCFQRKSGILEVFKNGVRLSQTSCDGTLYKNDNSKFYIGNYTGDTGYNADILEFKVSNIARYDGNYTPSDDTWVK